MNSSYHIIRIQRYLNGELSRAEMYQLEREALDDPLLQDALDGYRLQKEVSHGRLSLLQQRLATRIAGQQRERNAFFFGWQRLGVAATACVLMVLVLVLLWIRNFPDRPVASQKEVQVELSAPSESTGVHAMGITATGLDAAPIGGWEQFNSYLATERRDLAATGQVTLTFDVDPQGRPVAIQSSGTDDTGLQQQARELLAQGPAWSGTKGKLVITFE